jgi:NADPH:quinone reductase-like Zn-dependent oxidoreductase
VCLIGTKTFATWVTDTQELFVKIPDNLSFIDASTMVLVFGTAIHSLINMGRLEEGQSVLIHSGCGGAGLAAIQIAQMVGAEIYTTVSSEAKGEYLMKTFGIPRSHIFDSRSTTFVEGIMRQTNNRGVDVILNSLSGELLHATWRCAAKFGTMVEIGKRDILGAGKLDMDMFLDNRNYCCVDIDQMRAERPKQLAK